jgi:hypothetical protein
MLSDREIDDMREQFAVKSMIVIMELQEMIEKANKLAAQLAPMEPSNIDNDSRVSTIDFYRPMEEDGGAPAKKRVKM